jgi:hypothetical protein
MKRILLFFFLFAGFLFSQSTWNWSGRVHPELKWSTLKTEHFNIHYHQGLDSIAVKGASLAEQVYPILLKQMELDSIPTIDIIFTSEDEIMNGFALWTYTTFIWVDQNDAAIWLEDKKWLFQVVSHELQHIFFFHRIRTWMPQPWAYLLSGIPGWVVEGLAEYETERWRPYRADISHKTHVLKNELNKMDPHHDGFSKLLYWSDRFGDSTIVQALQYRNAFKLLNFKKGFKKATDISLKQFNENWRRHMNTYYYGYRSQKEALEEVGKVVTLPIKKLRGFRFAPDSSKIALIGQDDEDQLDASFLIAVRDTTKENKRQKKLEQRKHYKSFLAKFLKTKQDTSKKNARSLKPIWKKDLIDFGQFHPSISWAPNDKHLVYTKYHFGQQQSLVWDLRIYNLEKKKGFWLTHSLRASYPDWSPTGDRILFVAHQNNVSNLFTIKANGDSLEALTHYTDDTQIVNPAWSPDGKKIVFAMAGPEGNMDLYLMDIPSQAIKRLTHNPAVDYRPVWNPDGRTITYTSHAGGTPNLYTLDVSTGDKYQVTDVGDAIWSTQWVPKDTVLFATTLADVDTVRVLKVNPRKSIVPKPPSFRKTYTSWREAGPKYPLTHIDPSKEPVILKKEPYRFTHHIKHVTSLVIPSSEPFGFTQWSDAMGRNIISFAGIFNPADPGQSGGLINYTDAQHGPLWGVGLFYNIYGSYRPYDKSKYGLWDQKNGAIISTILPFNRGNNLYADHQITLSVTLYDHNPVVADSIDRKTGSWIDRDPANFQHLPVPDKGKEGLLSLSYQWTARRPHKWNLLHPTQGYGIYGRFDYANANLFGKFNYRRLITDAFINIPIEKTALYLRLKTVSQFGSPPAQDYIGFTEDFPIYLNTPLPSISDALPENNNPRGWDGYRLGNRLLFGSIEYRLPLVPKVVSAALISDFGNAWYSGKEKQDWVFTAGAEIRLSLQILTLSYGTAQLTTDWQKNKTPDQYFRLALINPF